MRNQLWNTNYGLGIPKNSICNTDEVFSIISITLFSIYPNTIMENHYTVMKKTFTTAYWTILVTIINALIIFKSLTVSIKVNPIKINKPNN
jgi:hypothetical protein